MKTMPSYNRRTVEPKSPVRTVPLLHNGDHMKQPEFHRRYKAMNEDTKFELIGGVVYMAAAVHRWHGTYHPELSFVLTHYKCATPGVEVADNMTAVLDEDAEPQPDLMLRVLTEYGGQSEYDAENCLIGAPELAAEIAHSSAAIDLNTKLLDYRRTGVREYIVMAIEEKKLHWFHFPTQRRIRPDRRGIFKSRVFPGLWINEPALIARDTHDLLRTILRGLKSPEHAKFVAKLARKKK